MKDHLVEFNKREGAQEYISLEKLIPKLPSSLFGLIFKSIPSLESIEVKLSINNLTIEIKR